MISRFDELQATLPGQWPLISSLNHEPHSVVVVPSMSLSVDVPEAVLRAYEERMLFLLLLLRQARTRVIYVTSQPVLPEVVDYYLSLMPGIIPSQARKRLFMTPVLDGTSRPLSEKILARPRVLERIRALIPDPAACHLIPFVTTDLEQELAVRLGIPMYAADPAHFRFGTKSGGRRLFAEEGVAHPAGAEDLHSLADVVGALARLRAERPGLAAAVVKLNDAVSGQGNAVVDLRALPAAGAAGEAAELQRRVMAMRLEQEGGEIARYLERLGEDGGIVEERLAGEEFASPSVQLRVTPAGDVQLLSTHDQMLGGASGQSYLGCIFPALPEYAAAISEMAGRVGRRLAREGVIGRFALDFVAVRDGCGAWRSYAIEINLRKGGTTHPYLTLEFLTDGRYDSGSGRFLAPNGRREALRGERPRRVGGVPLAGAGGPVRHRDAARPPLQPGEPDRDRLPHDQRGHGARPLRAHCGRRLARPRDRDLRAGAARAARGGGARRRLGWRHGAVKLRRDGDVEAQNGRFEMGSREFFTARWEAESKAFVNVLKAMPEGNGDYRPHPRSRSAAELAWVLTSEAVGMLDLIEKGELDWKDTPPPAKLHDIAERYAAAHQTVASRLKHLDDAAWAANVQFKMGGEVAWEAPLGEMLWGFLFDAIHHRGQLSTYLRPMGGKVPSIYGPSADDPGGQ